MRVITKDDKRLDPLLDLGPRFGFMDPRSHELIKQTGIHITHSIAGEQMPGPRTNRKEYLVSFIKHQEKALNCLRHLDPWVVLSIPPGKPVAVANYAADDDEEPKSATLAIGVTSRILLEYELWISSTHTRIASAKANASKEKANKRGAPPTSEPVMFAIEALAYLFGEYLEKPVSGSTKEGEFGHFVTEFFRLLPDRPQDSEVKTCLRRFIAAIQKPRQQKGVKVPPHAGSSTP